MGIDLKKYKKNEWMKGSDLEEGERLTLTIDKVYEHTFPSGQEKIVFEFLEHDQKMPLNKTRQDKMEDLFGDDTDDWAGQKIDVYQTDVQFGGKTEIGIAIGKPLRKKARPIEDDVDEDVEFVRRAA
jgi:hypothetical protein